MNLIIYLVKTLHIMLLVREVFVEVELNKDTLVGFSFYRYCINSVIVVGNLSGLIRICM